MTPNGIATLEMNRGALNFKIEVSYRSFAAVTHTIEANRFTMFFARRFGSRDSFLDLVTRSVVTVAVWDGKEYFLSSKKVKT